MFAPPTHLLLDAACMGEHMDTAKEHNKQHDCLYRGGKEERLSVAAPYIFQFSCPTTFSDWFMDEGWGRSWGVLFRSSWSLPDMHRHFRKLLIVTSQQGRQLYFRFYDPRVLRTYLPTCNAAELREFFGPIDYFLMEDQDPAFALRFWQAGGVLNTQRSKLDEAAGVIGGRLIKKQPGSAAAAEEPQPSTTQQPDAPAQEALPAQTPEINTKWHMFD